jgi:hypothetical protein
MNDFSDLSIKMLCSMFAFVSQTGEFFLIAIKFDDDDLNLLYLILVVVLILVYYHFIFYHFSQSLSSGIPDQ